MGNDTRLSPFRQTTSSVKTALALLKLGYWAHLIHPDEKRPIGRAWAEKRWDQGKIDKTAECYPAAGVGVALGPDRAPKGGWLIDLEGDGDQAADSLARLLGGEVPYTPAWSSTRGNHTLFTADGPRLQKALIAAGAEEGTDERGKGAWHLPELPGLEIRCGGYKADGKTVKQVQSVVPPTPGTDGTPRIWAVQPSTSVEPLPEAAYAFLEQLAAEKARKAEAAAGDSNGKVAGASARTRRRGPLSIEDRAIKYLAKIEPAVSGQGGHDKTFGAACRVGPGFDLPEATTLRLIRDHYNPRCQPPWSDKELEHKVQDAYRVETERGWLLKGRSDRSRRYGAPPSKNGDGRAEIEISTRRDLALEETLKALAGDRELFCRGTSLGVVAREENDTAKLPGGVELRHARGSLRFVPIAPTVLGCRLTKLASFFRWVSDKAGESIAIDCHPPDWLIGAVSDHQYWPGVRHLLSIAECPYIRDDGSIVSPGFDASTGTLYRPSVTIPPLPDRPTTKDVQAALELLTGLVIQFPFETGFDRDVWLADLFTCIQRPMIAGPVPGFVYNGNAAGVGKGLLIDLVGLLVHGVPVGTRIYPIDPAEAAKVKLALALAAVPIVHFDNLAEGGFYGGGVMDSALTSTVTSDRILGQSRDSGNVPLRPAWHLSGNNISPVRDSGRRWLRCNLKTTLEKPYERDDIEEKHLRDSTLKCRAELLRTALIILKAHALADRPTGTTDGKPWAPLGSFEDWDHVVRGAVHFATGNDCLHTQREGEKERPDRLNKAALLEGWLEVDPRGEGKTIEEVIDAVRDNPTSYPTLRNALLSIGRDGKIPSSEKLRYKLRGMKNTPINRLRFETCGENRNGTSLWRVVAC
jgi:hypothetical protein